MVIQVAKIVTIAPWTVGSLSFLVNFIYYHPYPQTAPDWKTDRFRHRQGDVSASQTLS